MTKRSRSRGLEVAADREPIAQRALVEDDLLDIEVPGHHLVAARSGEAGLRLGGVAAQLLPDDAVAACPLEVAAVLCGVEPRSATHSTRPSFRADRSSFACPISSWSLALPGVVQTRMGIP